VNLGPWELVATPGPLSFLLTVGIVLGHWKIGCWATEGIVRALWPDDRSRLARRNLTWSRKDVR
jgi:hypothetical protein